MMAGALDPDDGKVAVGASVTMGYFAQHQMEQLTADRSVIEELVAHSPNIEPRHRYEISRGSVCRDRPRKSRNAPARFRKVPRFDVGLCATSSSITLRSAVSCSI